jgi:uncharacterized protein (TIGR02145 family)
MKPIIFGALKIIALFLLALCAGAGLRLLYEDINQYRDISSADARRFADAPMFTDVRDGKTYRIVQMGDQTWMAENLNYETPNSSWCYDSKASNCAKYGRLYTWDAAMEACPAGWRLPAEEEWDKLVAFAGGRDIAGTTLQSKLSDWNKLNGTDDYGFSALTGGARHPDGLEFFALGSFGNWWTATESEWGNSSAESRSMDTRNSYVNRSGDLKKSGFSVRCLQD